MAPRVSILLPAFDAALTLDACLRSVARQTETRFECLIVDDGSRDDTAAIAARWAAADGRFRLLCGRHAGLVPTLARGLEACRAPYVARMDADDLMHRRRLAAQLAALDAAPGLAAVGCHVRLFPRGAALQPRRRAYESWLNGLRTAADVRRDAFVECPIAHPSLCARREELVAFGYRDRGWPEDYDLVLRLLEAGREVGVVPERLLGWRDHPGRLSRTAATYGLERFTACRAEFLVRGWLATSAHYVLWGYGDTGRSLRRALAGHGRTPSHVVELHPGRVGNRIHGAPVVTPDALGGLRGARVLVSVAGARARSEIRAALARMGFEELHDFVCCA
ncbi:MAG: glycosyltransferase family 2 protein [Myxococcales bacterium]|nr:glycosyltransferase family 2 protein [Myxococcales bacterium]